MSDSEAKLNPSLSAGDILKDRFEIVRRLGSGGMSTVYLAIDRHLDRQVALKFLDTESLQDKTALERFQREARTTSMLEHPCIAQVLAFDVTENATPYLVMEYIDGITLAELLQKEKTLKRERISALFVPLIEALAYAHSKGILHRDIKPNNIMVCREEGGDTPKLVDFGIAKVVQGRQDMAATATSTLGSPLYMSPEQCQAGQLDWRTDMYSLACVLFECMTGQPPFLRENAMQTMMAHVSEPIPSMMHLNQNLQISQKLLSCIESCLAKNQSERPASLEDLKTALLSDTASEPAEAPLPASRKALPLTILMICAILLSAVTIAVFKHNRQTESIESIAAKPARTASPRGWPSTAREAHDYFMKASDLTWKESTAPKADLPAIAAKKYDMMNKSMALYEKAISQAEKTNLDETDTKSLANVENDYCLTLRSSGYTAKALAIALKARELTPPNSIDRISITGTIADMQLQLNDKAGARKSYEANISLAKQNPDLRCWQYTANLTKYADFLDSENMPNKAIEIRQQALVAAHQCNDLTGSYIVNATRRLTASARQRNDVKTEQKLLAEIKTAAQTQKEWKPTDQTCESLLALAQLFYEGSKPNEALWAATKGIELTTQFDPDTRRPVKFSAKQLEELKSEVLKKWPDASPSL